MGTVWNLRGTNGAGKSTLARALLPPDALRGGQTGGPIDILWAPSPTKTDPGRMRLVEGHIGYLSDVSGMVAHVGPYQKTTGGMDAISRFAQQQEACRILLGERFHADHVIAEGLLAAHVYGSWAALDKELEAAGHRFAFVYLRTSLEECHRRVEQRQAAALARGVSRKPINWALVDSQYKSILRTREFALRDGRLVYDVPEGDLARVTEVMLAVMDGNGEAHRVG
jgi:hypothetical protein